MNEEQLTTLIALLLRMDERLNLLEVDSIGSPVILQPKIMELAKMLGIEGSAWLIVDRADCPRNGDAIGIDRV